MTPAPDVLIRLAQTEEIIDLRHVILRAGLPRQLACFEGDDEPATRHVVATIDGKIVGCATVLRRPWEGNPAWQLRGMAIADGLRGRGIGTKMLDAIEAIVRSESSHSLQMWCNARTPAQRFYERAGWRVVSGEFVVEHAGPHVKMVKTLAIK
jgi:predicted GNAT family N-acyltransferase